MNLDISIKSDDFIKWLVTLCLKSGLVVFPKNIVDQHILLKSALLGLDSSTTYSEKEINEHLKTWINQVCHMQGIDQVMLRRRLIDSGYLTRSRDGAAYRVSTEGAWVEYFDKDIDQLDIPAEIEKAREAIKLKKIEHINQTLREQSEESHLHKSVFPPIIKTVDLPPQVTLQYVVQGKSSGLPVIFLHGFSDSWISFKLVLPHLPDTMRAFVLTQRGHGEASKPKSGYSVNHFSADLEAFMRSEQLDNAVIVGHSMGCAVAIRFAIDNPDRTLGLVLAGASSSLRGTNQTRQFWDSILSELTDPIDPMWARQMTESMLVQPVPQDFLEKMFQESTKLPAHVWKAAFESRWRLEGDYESELGDIKAVTLVIWGDQDKRNPRSEQETLLKEIPNAQLSVYSGCGHLLHWEKPDRFARDLVRFVEEHIE